MVESVIVRERLVEKARHVGEEKRRNLQVFQFFRNRIRGKERAWENNTSGQRVSESLD
jgi:hypothetical protein